VKATEVTAGLAESNGSLLPGLWRDSVHVTCGLTACTPGSAPGPTLGNEYGKTLPLPLLLPPHGAVNNCQSVDRPAVSLLESAARVPNVTTGSTDGRVLGQTAAAAAGGGVDAAGFKGRPENQLTNFVVRCENSIEANRDSGGPPRVLLFRARFFPTVNINSLNTDIRENYPPANFVQEAASCFHLSMEWTPLPAGPDLREASHQQRASLHQTVHILSLANDRCLRDYDLVVAHC